MLTTAATVTTLDFQNIKTFIFNVSAVVLTFAEMFLWLLQQLFKCYLLQDFDVGKSYKKRVTLTNVSYSINFCKLTGLSDHLKDFLEIT